MPGVPWSAEDRAYAESLLRDGWHPAEIGARLGRTKHAVRHLAGILRLTRPKAPDWKAGELKRLKADYHDPNITLAAICAKYRRTRHAILQQAHCHGWRRRTKKWTAADIEALKRLYPAPDGPSIAELVRKLGHPARSIYPMKAKLGLKRHPEFIHRLKCEVGQRGNQVMIARRLRGQFKDVPADVLKQEERTRAFWRMPRVVASQSYMGSSLGDAA